MPTSYGTLFDDYAKLAGYDILILQCEGAQRRVPEDCPTSFANIRRYADNGGRIFDEHVHSFWIANGPSALARASRSGCTIPT